MLKICSRAFVVAAWWVLPAVAISQSLNIDVGEADSGPPATYAAAGRAGFWNSMEAAHNTTEGGLVDVHGNPTPVTLRQIGGLQLLDDNDPAITGDDALLMDDFLVTYDAVLESCIFLANLEAGTYEVLIYARMPDPEIFSYADVDQEAGNPHVIVGGEWSGQHQELISYSRHLAIVGAGGVLNLHSGIVPEADPSDGAALGGLQLLRLDIFADGFETGDTSRWTSLGRGDPTG